MTEAEWLACTDPTPMLEYLRGKASNRKLRLFACACCRRVWSLLSDKYSRKALTIAERYADAEVSEEKLGFAWGDARRSAQVAHRRERETAEASAMWAVSMLCETDIGRALAAVELAARCEAYPVEQPRLANAQREQIPLLRDIFGNPFRLVAINPAWFTPTVSVLAAAAYDERHLPSGTLDDDRIKVLADALEDAGCDNADILAHCRLPGTHVRGCWVVDSILRRD